MSLIEWNRINTAAINAKDVTDKKPTYFFYFAEKASETSFRQYQDTSAMYYRSLSLLIYKLKWYHNPNNADG